MTANSDDRPLLVGATAADPGNVVTIWNAIRDWLNENGLPVEYALFSSYDALCGALLRGEVDIAWNAPMAHAQTLLASGGTCRTLAMRDTDRDVATVIIARTDSGIDTLADLRGRRIALGLPTSTELRLLPVHHLRQAGIDLERDCELVHLEPRRYPGGQRWVDDFMIFDAVLNGAADAGTIFEPWLEPLLASADDRRTELKVLWRSAPFCHCAFTGRPGLPANVADRFVRLLLSMDAAEPRVAEMMRLEHLKRWVPADEQGWSDILDAIVSAGVEGVTFN